VENHNHDDLCALLRAKSTIAPSRVVEAVQARVAQIARGAERRNGIEHTLLACGFVALLVCAIALPHPITIAAFALYIAAAIPYATILIRQGRPAAIPAAAATMGEHFTYYRAELERERGLSRHTAPYAVPLFASSLLAYVGVRAYLRAQGMPTEVMDLLFVGYGGAALVLLGAGFVVAVRNRRRLGQEMAALN
jgi:hypothetical protein